jgi:hypothetical protein
MSRYRDDSTETAVTASKTWVRIKAIAEDSAITATALIFGLLLLHQDSARVQDAVQDNARTIVIEQARALDAAPNHLHATQPLYDQLTLAERWAPRLRVLHQEHMAMGDEVADRSRRLIRESARVSDALLAQRRAASMVMESARAADSTGQYAQVLVLDQATLADTSPGKARARTLAIDTALVGDEYLDSHQVAGGTLTDTARAASAVLDHLHAHQLVVDGALLTDEIPGDSAGAQAWTANVQSWAMSRYQPYRFDGLAVIDGKLYGTTADGVYALDGGTAPVTASLVTGKVDLGQGSLVHPVAAYLEYSLEGSMAMAVTTTQTGAAVSYSYPLAAESATELTNGRIPFGRGLRGRHFSFELTVTGTAAHINDLRVEAAPTARRV